MVVGQHPEQWRRNKSWRESVERNAGSEQERKLSEQCGQKAVRRYTWPGRDEAFICQEHLPKLLGVVTAMGMHLQLIPLDEDTPEVCTQQVSKS